MLLVPAFVSSSSSPLHPGPPPPALRTIPRRAAAVAAEACRGRAHRPLLRASCEVRWEEAASERPGVDIAGLRVAPAGGCPDPGCEGAHMHPWLSPGLDSELGWEVRCPLRAPPPRCPRPPAHPRGRATVHEGPRGTRPRPAARVALRTRTRLAGLGLGARPWG